MTLWRAPLQRISDDAARNVGALGCGCNFTNLLVATRRSHGQGADGRSLSPRPPASLAALGGAVGLDLAPLAGFPFNPHSCLLGNPYSSCYNRSFHGLDFDGSPLLPLTSTCAGTSPLLLHQYRMAPGRPYDAQAILSPLSALLTQPGRAVLNIWTEDPQWVSENPFMRWLLRHFGVDAKGAHVHDLQLGVRLAPTIRIRHLNIRSLAKGTPLEDSPHLDARDSRAWLNGDLARSLVLYAEGGVYVDGDMLFMRSLDRFACMSSGFVLGWGCYGPEFDPQVRSVGNGPPGYLINAAFSGFPKPHSRGMRRFLQAIHDQGVPESAGTQWNCAAGIAALKTAAGMGEPPPFALLPWCYAEPSACKYPEEFAELIEAPEVTGLLAPGDTREELLARNAHRISGLWVLHWHNRYTQKAADGWVMARLRDAIFTGLALRYGAAIGDDLPEEDGLRAAFQQARADLDRL
jgi:hypothetical protein